MTSSLRYLLILFLCGVMAACSDAGNDAAKDTIVDSQVTGSEQTGEPSSMPVAPTSIDAPDTESLDDVLSFVEVRLGDLDVMEEARVVRLLTVYGPGRYYLDGPQQEGLVAEMAKLFEEFLNQRMDRKHLKVHVVVIPVARDQLLPALIEGRGDLVSAGLTITDERLELVDFSVPSSKPMSEILVTGPSAPALESIEGLSGQTLYLRETSSYRESAEALNARLVAEGKEPVKIQYMSELLEDDDLIEMVNAGLLPWAVVDEYKPQLWEGVFTELKVRDDVVFREGGQLAWAMRKNSPQLKAAVDAFLKKHREGTLVGNVLRNRYIRDFDWAANALDAEDYKRFSDLEEIFRKYGEQYGVDYMLAAAQGYQESRLDQSVRSGAGAVGVMQLLPSTADDPNVNVQDIREVEANIHAGIKYLDYLKSRYFDDPEIDDLNKTLLALAAYNAGPSRMINLRSKAEKAGYNPNLWFDNVEVIAAQEIGRETVQYVANIYKYYLSYRMVAMQQLQHQAAREKVGI
jgi:membrane-bound lytic murein transglycosylase MltF